MDSQEVKASNRCSVSECGCSLLDQNSWQSRRCGTLPEDFGVHVEIARHDPQPRAPPNFSAQRLQQLLVPLCPLLCMKEVVTENYESPHDGQTYHGEPPLVCLKLFASCVPAKPIPAPNAWALRRNHLPTSPALTLISSSGHGVSPAKKPQSQPWRSSFPAQSSHLPASSRSHLCHQLCVRSPEAPVNCHNGDLGRTSAVGATLASASSALVSW